MLTKNWFLHNPTFTNSTDTKNIIHSVFHGISLLPRKLCLQNSQKQFFSSPVGSSLPKRNHSSASTPVLCKIKYISISIPYNKLLTDIGNKIYFGKTHSPPPPPPPFPRKMYMLLFGQSNSKSNATTESGAVQVYVFYSYSYSSYSIHIVCIQK